MVRPATTPSSKRSRTRSSTATSRTSGAPRKPRCATATSASSTSARSRPNIGTWMQNVVLGAYALKLTGSAGVRRPHVLRPARPAAVPLDDRRPARRHRRPPPAARDHRSSRRWLLSFGLAALVLLDDPPQAALVALVFAIGIANALGAPGLSAILPTLVPREDLPGAVALQSVQMNLSRVIGPAIGGVLYATFDAAPVFAINALTYAFAIIGLLWATLPAPRRRAGRRARRAAAALRRPHRRAATRCSRTSRHAVHVLVLLARVRRPDAGHRRGEPRHRPQEHRSTASCTPASASAPRWVRSRSAPCSRMDRRRGCCGRASSRSRWCSRCSRCCAAPRRRIRSARCSATSTSS